MELSEQDKQRIKHEAHLWANPKTKVIQSYTRLFDSFEKGAEYEHKYQREQQAELRNKVIEECIQSLKAKGVEGLDYNGKIILSTLNSLKTR